MSIELVIPSNHLILSHPLLLLPSIFPSIRVFSESALASGGQILDPGIVAKGFPGGSVGKETACNAGDTGDTDHPWTGEVHWRKAWQPTPLFLSREFYGQRNLTGYSPWGHKKSDPVKMTEHTDPNLKVHHPGARRQSVNKYTVSLGQTLGLRKLEGK